MKHPLLAALASVLLAISGFAAHSQTIVSYRHLVLDGHALKWGKPVLGTGATVTYALVVKDMRFDNARNCSSIGPVDALLAHSGIDPRDFVRELSEAFHVWRNAADISFVAGDPSTADILIGAQINPVGYAFANVDYDRTAQGPGPRTISRSMVCLNPTKAWKIGFDGNLEVYDLRYTLIHEIGHAIGLDHPAIAGQLMAYRYGERFRDLQAGDISGIETLYGPRRVQLGAVSGSSLPNSKSSSSR